MQYSTMIKQVATRNHATRHRTNWTESEIQQLNMIAAREDLESAAFVLGRTYFAVTTAHSLAQRGQLVPSTPRVAASDRPYRGWREGDGDE